MIEAGTVTLRTKAKPPAVEVVAADHRVKFSLDLLCDPRMDGDRLRVQRDVITIDCANGMLKYVVRGYEWETAALVCDLIFSTVEGIEV